MGPCVNSAFSRETEPIGYTEREREREREKEIHYRKLACVVILLLFSH